MLENKLKRNNDKAEALFKCTSSRSVAVSKATNISVCDSEISFSSSAWTLGFYITDDITVELESKKSPNQLIWTLLHQFNSPSSFCWQQNPL